MKKIFFIILFFICLKSFGQVPKYPSMQAIANSDSAIGISNAFQARAGFVNGAYADTTAANLAHIRQYIGAQIYTSTGNKIWLRNSTANRWIDLSGGSGSTPTLQEVLNAGGGGADLFENTVLSNTGLYSFTVMDNADESILQLRSGGQSGKFVLGNQVSEDLIRNNDGYMYMANPDSIVFNQWNEGVYSFRYIPYGSIDTSTYKPAAFTASGRIVRMNSWAQVSGGGSGSGTVNSGTATEAAYYAGTGTAVSSTPILTFGSTTTLSPTSGQFDITTLNHAVATTNKMMVWDTVSKRMASMNTLPVTLTTPVDGQTLVLAGSGTSLVNATISATPAGSSWQFQYNLGGAFAANDSTAKYAGGYDTKGGYYYNSSRVIYRPDQTNFLNDIFFGSSPAGLSHTTGITGQYNTGVGLLALNALTSGSQNVALGSRALQALNTGTKNTVVGEGAGIAISSGQDHTAIGNGALTSMQTGTQGNTAVGSLALNSSTGGYNTGIGLSVLSSNSSGANNTGVGIQTGFNNATGSNNSWFGSQAAVGVASNNNSNNTGIGFKVGYALTTGSNNIFVGYQAADAHTSGSNNIVIGYDIDAPSNTASNQLSLGNLIFGTGITGTGTTAAGKMGVLTNAPTHELTLNGQMKILAPNGTTDTPDSLAGFKDGVLTAYTTITSGTYTPTLFNTTNVSASTAYSCQYMRIGNVVTVSGAVDLSPTSGSLNTELGISLPIASNFAADNNCGGTGASQSNLEAAAIFAEPTNDRARIQYAPAATGSRTIHFSFTYQVI